MVDSWRKGTYCGVFRRQAIDKGAHQLAVDHIVTGHNADDVAETVLMNVLRGDIARVERCTAITTGSDSCVPHDDNDEDSGSRLPHTIKRSKPFKYTYEKEIVMYAYFKKLDYHSTECIYSPTAYRGYARALVKDLEKIRPSAIVDIVRLDTPYASLCSHFGTDILWRGDCQLAQGRLGRPKEGEPQASRATYAPHRCGSLSSSGGAHESEATGSCERCGALSSQPLCQACLLLEGLNKGSARISVA